MERKKLQLTLGVIVICLTVLLNSCATKRNLVYFSNLPDSTLYREAILNHREAKIQPGDALSIKVSTLNPDANIMFNSGSLPMSNLSTGVSSGVTSTSTSPDGFIVDENGQIAFPVLGLLSLKGLSVKEAQTKIANEIAKSAKNPIVNIRILNYKITVIGEVSKPGIYSVSNNKINILEAIGMAGDMTPYAIRSNVILIREENGERTVNHIDFNNKSILNSPYYNLKQNDIVYVQPENRLKAAQANNGDYRLWSIILSGISVLSIVLYRIL